MMIHPDFPVYSSEKGAKGFHYPNKLLPSIEFEILNVLPYSYYPCDTSYRVKFIALQISNAQAIALGLEYPIIWINENGLLQSCGYR